MVRRATCEPAGNCTPTRAKTSVIEIDSPTEKVWMQPISSEATKAPPSEPRPPTTTMTKTMLPTAAAMPGSVTKALPPMTPASPASAVPPPKTSMKMRGTLWPSASTMSGLVSAAWMMRPMRVRVSSA
jgi:hypothetical protein